MYEEGSEPLIPERTGVSLPGRRWLSPWMAGGVLSAIVFVALSRIPASNQNGDIFDLFAAHPILYRAYFGFLGNTVFLEIAALLAVWVALLRPAWSDRLLWCAATVLTSAFIIVPLLSRTFYRHDYATIAMIGYPSWAVVAWYSSIRLLWRWVVSIACVVSFAFAFAVPTLGQLPPIYLAGSFALACSIWCFSVALVSGFGIDIFERARPLGDPENLSSG